MIAWQNIWIPTEFFTIEIRHREKYTEVWFPRMTEPWIVIDNHGMQLIFQSVDQTPRKVEAAIVYENL